MWTNRHISAGLKVGRIAVSHLCLAESSKAATAGAAVMPALVAGRTSPPTDYSVTTVAKALLQQQQLLLVLLLPPVLFTSKLCFHDHVASPTAQGCCWRHCAASAVKMMPAARAMLKEADSAAAASAAAAEMQQVDFAAAAAADAVPVAALAAMHHIPSYLLYQAFHSRLLQQAPGTAVPVTARWTLLRMQCTHHMTHLGKQQEVRIVLVLACNRPAAAAAAASPARSAAVAALSASRAALSPPKQPVENGSAAAAAAAQAV
jgi:hypothetical protein